MKISNAFLSILEHWAKNVSKLSPTGRLKNLDLLRNLIRLLTYAGGKK